MNASGSSGGCLRSNVMWEVVEIDVLVRAVAGKSHHNIDDDATVLQAARRLD